MKKLSGRFLIATGALACGIVLVHAAPRPVRVPVRRPLRELPTAIGRWSATDIPVEQSVLKTLGVHDYVHRLYAQADGAAVQLYVGYFEGQRAGERIHSPKICLPAAGWEPLRWGRTSTQLGGRPAIINEYVIQKDGQRQLVLYWYQGRGRTLASEYWAKLWVVIDSVARHRTDGALVRAIVAFDRGEVEARAQATEFIGEIDPWLNEFIPN